MDVSIASNTIKAAGPNKVRIVPMLNESIDSGLYQIEVLNESKLWTSVLTGLPKPAAEEIVTRANNRVLCG